MDGSRSGGSELNRARMRDFKGFGRKNGVLEGRREREFWCQS